ncbi:MAG: helix-turn-helix transcriptional regulator [Christensenellaceae bacterium]|nr:helix-turn-helix transcriptional regulator [Christensenellaceae bacterium]
MPIREVFADRLKEIRKAKEMTQDEMASALGCSRMSYVYYENAKRTPDIDFLDRLHTCTGYTAEYLMGYTENKTAETMGLQQKIGLEDDAIRILQNDPSAASAINFIINHKDFDSFMAGVNLALYEGYFQWRCKEKGIDTKLGDKLIPQWRFPPNEQEYTPTLKAMKALTYETAPAFYTFLATDAFSRIMEIDEELCRDEGDSYRSRLKIHSEYMDKRMEGGANLDGEQEK